MLNIRDLIDDAKDYEMLPELRWPNGVHWPYCAFHWVTKRGFHNREKYRQRYVCGSVALALCRTPCNPSCHCAA